MLRHLKPSHLSSDLYLMMLYMVNIIKTSALNTRVFRQLCQDFESDEEVLIFHTEIRWLSRGNVVSKVESLKEELTELLKRDNT